MIPKVGDFILLYSYKMHIGKVTASAIDGFSVKWSKEKTIFYSDGYSYNWEILLPNRFAKINSSLLLDMLL